MGPTITVLMDLPPEQAYHRATVVALGHAADALGVSVDVRVVTTDAIGALGHGVVIGPGSPYRDPMAVESVIRQAREHGLPLVGTWGGFQYVLVEHARTLVGIADAAHAESDAGGTPVATLLACSLRDNEIEIELAPDTRLRAMYGNAATVRERTTCNYGLAPDLAYIAASHGMAVAASDDTGEVRAIERTHHPFFVATLYQPQLSSAPGRPHPIWRAFVQAVTSSRAQP